MLILPSGGAQRAGRPPRITKRERVIIGAVTGVAVALIVAVVVSLAASGGHRTGGSCVDVTFPIAIGGQEIYDCGVRARELCASVGRPQGATGVEGQAVAVQCRKAGLPVG